MGSKNARANAAHRKTTLYTTSKKSAKSKTKSSSGRGTQTPGNKMMYNGTQH